MENLTAQRHKKTRIAYVVMHLANEPFLALFTLLSFILRKDLQATTLQLSIFATLRPVISFFSFYWSSTIARKKESLLKNLIGAWLLGRIPFLLFPFFDNVWYLIFASAMYQLFYRAGTPAIMEILKINIDKKPRENLFSLVFILGFLESILLGFFVGKLLDFHSSVWKYLFALCSLVSILSILFQRAVPLPKQQKDPNLPSQTNKFIQPWKDCIYLMKSNREFAIFQWGFMIGGFGLMLIAPALAIYYADQINISHHELTMARYIWMGFGVLLTTGIWKRALNKLDIPLMTFFIVFGFALFPLTLLFAQNSLIYLNLAFFLYGVSQAGSHLLWHLSGTIFAKENESSSKYTGVNLLLLGIRGLVGPILGGFLSHKLGPNFVLILGSITCFSGMGYLLMIRKKTALRPFGLN